MYTLLRKTLCAIALLTAIFATNFISRLSAESEAAPSITFASLLDEMVGRSAVSRAPEFPYTLKQQSSYDRASVSTDKDGWFANKDWSNYIREEENEGRKEYVMFEAEGPGAVVRIWLFCTPYVGNIRFYIDGNPTPVIDGPIENVIGGKQLVGSPLSAVCAMGQNLYLPIPYAKSCKITVDVAPENMTEGNDRLVYYNVNYRTYSEGTKITSFNADTLKDNAEKIKQVQERLAGDLRVPPSTEIPGSMVVEGLTMINSTYSELAPLESKIIEQGKTENAVRITGIRQPEMGSFSCYVIRKLSLKVDAKDLPQALRSTFISLTFDGKRTVFCPIGDFFGSGVGINPHKTCYTKVEPDGTLTAYWEMPFINSFSCDFSNYGEQNVQISLNSCLANKIIEQNIHFEPEHLSHYFHAAWRQTRRISTRPVTDWNCVTIKGKGIYVGDVLSLVNYHPFWWGEGDEKIYVDGEEFPSHFGTGTEDYYGYAWSSTDFFEHPFI
ncbi:MAG: DUF2961 domain-containing protein, partial [Thermoguttaceae bacterium]